MPRHTSIGTSNFSISSSPENTYSVSRQPGYFNTSYLMHEFHDHLISQCNVTSNQGYTVQLLGLFKLKLNYLRASKNYVKLNLRRLKNY